MRRALSRCITLLAAVAALGTGMPARATGPAETPAPARTGIDPALRNALTGVATALLTEFAVRLAAGATDGFDPGPALERAAARLLAGGDLDRLIDGVLGQALGPGSTAAADLPPELRAALALLARSAIASARREFAPGPAR
ncbi:MAG: hypothetical protein JNM90_08450 [Burkholderiales bacterium]|nr:hypothetical protein [Burkholderiales bacterium]